MMRGYNLRTVRQLALTFMLGVGIAACSDSSDMASTPITDGGEAMSYGAVKQDSVEKAKGHERARQVKERNEARLLAKKGVNGVGVGQNEDGSPNVIVFTKDANADVPAEVEGYKVKKINVGEIKAMGFTGTYRPVSTGISVGNRNEASSGTIGAIVTRNGYRYMLSNNHVFARSNAAQLGEAIVQPGRADAYAPSQIGVLSGYRPITFGSTTNQFDAAVAQITTTNTPWTVNNYYKPSNYVMNPYVGLAVKKVGRTTGYTTGTIAATNVTVLVGYPGGTATFVNQIYVASSFIQAGDSGSLMVTNSGNYPVGLNFAGGNGASFANPIMPVMQYFGVQFAQ
jgi:hypothetical protein